MKELFDYIFKLDLKSLFITKTNNTFIQFFRYIFVGGVAFLADGGSLFLITTIGVNYLISVIFAFVIGLAVNYGLSKLLVFENSSVNGKIEFLVYGIIGVIGLGFTEIIMYVLTEIAGLYFMVSKVIATIIVLVWNFVARKITLYRKNRLEIIMKKVVIIGAGPAGITAAFQLLKNTKDEYEIIILEESNEIGGISRTVRHNGNRMDIGGHRFFSKDDNVTKWWAGIMPTQGADAYDDKILGRKKALAENGPDPEKDDEVMLIRNRVSRIYYKKKFFDYPISLKWETIKNMGFFTTICAGFSYLKACVFKKKETSLENFYINRFGRKLYSMFLRATQKSCGDVTLEKYQQTGGLKELRDFQ